MKKGNTFQEFVLLVITMYVCRNVREKETAEDEDEKANTKIKRQKQLQL